MVPNKIGTVLTIEECKSLAIKGKFDTFALQYGQECWAGNKPAFYKLGEETNKGNCGMLGGFWSNQVY